MSKEQKLSNGVMLNAYPDSIGQNLAQGIAMLQRPEFKDVFSLFYILPTFFNSDLDRGFSIIDYDINKDLVSEQDIKDLDDLNILLKFDIILNHLSVASPQFRDLLLRGEDSIYKDFFINWNSFWQGNGTLNDEGVMVPHQEHLSKLFMRKPGLPILKVRYPDGKEAPFWNTFYQQVNYQPLTPAQLGGVPVYAVNQLCELINKALEKGESINTMDFGNLSVYKELAINTLEQNRTYLGQMDVNGESPLVWQFYEETLAKLKNYGCKILRLDAFAYLHKEVGQSNFFNIPGTWDYLERFRQLADKNELLLLPEIHAEYGLHLHDEVASKGYVIYDFFLPGLIIHTLEKRDSSALIKWANEIVVKGYQTVNMLGCHDGIPVLDLKGKEVNGTYNEGLLSDREIEDIMDTVIARGGRVKNLYGPSGEKISYYQVNATFYSALGEDDLKMILARAIQLFMPGIPQVWYLDVFAGKNDYIAADNGGSAGHKEINRTTLTTEAIDAGLTKEVVLKQLELIGLRNTSSAFSGKLHIENSAKNRIDMKWENEGNSAHLIADLSLLSFQIKYSENGIMKSINY